MNTRGFNRFLSLLGILGRPVANTNLTTAGAGTLTAAGLIGGLVTRTGPTAAFTDTTSTAALLIAGLPIGVIPTSLSWETTIFNNTAYVQTLSGGTGATLSGITVIPPYSSGTFLITIASSTTYTVVGIGNALANSPVSEVVVTTNVILAAESGSTYYLTLAGGFTSTLPAPALGLFFRFICAVAPTTSYIITTNAGANLIYGMFEERAGTAGVAGAAQDTQNFVANQAKIGDWAEYSSDGTNWYVHGMVDVAAGITFSVT